MDWIFDINVLAKWAGSVATHKVDPAPNFLAAFKRFDLACDLCNAFVSQSAR
jgi:hypothetical protein